MPGLMDIPGLGGYVASQQMRQQRDAGDLQQAQQAMGLMQMLGQRKEDDQIKAIIESGAPPEKIVNALMATGPKGAAAAHQYATAIKDMQTAKATESLRGLTPEQLQDPNTLDRLGASGLPGTSHLTGVAERLRKKSEAEAALKTMRRVPDESGALTGGHFGSLMTSEIPAIANQARTAQQQLEASGGAVSPQHWIDLQKSLATQEAGQLERRSAREEAGRGKTAAADAARTSALQKRTQALGGALEKANLPEADATLRAVEDILAKKPELAEWISGPKSAVPDVMAPKDVQDARQAFAKLFNVTLKLRSGAAVTQQELDRLKGEFGVGVTKDPAQVGSAVEQARNLITKHYRSVSSGHGPDALNAYNENLRATGGTPLLEAGEDKPVAAPAATPAPPPGFKVNPKKPK